MSAADLREELREERELKLIEQIERQWNMKVSVERDMCEVLCELVTL